jgi:hypothetical protein
MYNIYIYNICIGMFYKYGVDRKELLKLNEEDYDNLNIMYTHICIYII